jgi:hypothetical protein
MYSVMRSKDPTLYEQNKRDTQKIAILIISYAENMTISIARWPDIIWENVKEITEEIWSEALLSPAC